MAQNRLERFIFKVSYELKRRVGRENKITYGRFIIFLIAAFFCGLLLVWVSPFGIAIFGLLNGGGRAWLLGLDRACNFSSAIFSIPHNRASKGGEKSEKKERCYERYMDETKTKRGEVSRER